MRRIGLIGLLGVAMTVRPVSSALFGSTYSDTISNPAQPLATLSVEQGRYAWHVADWMDIQAKTREIATPWVDGGRSVEAVWRKDGLTIRRETYQLPADCANFAAHLEEKAARIVVPVEMPYAGKLTVAIDDEKGNRVRNLVCGISCAKGRHDAVWDGYSEDGAPVAPGKYVARLAHHPGLSFDYLGYFINGDEPDNWIPWGPNHVTLKCVLARGPKIAAGAYFTEGGHSTVILDAETGRFQHGWGDNWNGANDEMHFVDGPGDRFYAVRGRLSNQTIEICGYSWTTDRKADVRIRGAVPKTRLVGAATVGSRLFVANGEGKTLDEYEIRETPDRTEIAFVSSRSFPEPCVIRTWNGKLYRAPAADIYDMTTDGREIFALKNGSSVVHVYDKQTRKEVRTIGEPGGFYLGAWRRDRLVNPAGLAITDKGALWITETRFAPKRLSKWDAKTGRCLYEKFGPSAYGYPGMGMDPNDSSRWMAYDCLWAFDEKTGKDRPVSVVLPQDRGRGLRSAGAGFVDGTGATDANPLPDVFMHYTWLERAGRTFVMGQGKAATLFELKDKVFRPLAFLSSVHQYQCAVNRQRETTKVVPALLEAYRRAHPEIKEKDLEKAMRWDRSPLFWKDLNRDGTIQADEFSFLPGAAGAGGSWGFWPETLDFAWPVTTADGRNWVLDFSAGDLKGDALPEWDMTRALAGKRAVSARLPAGTGPLAAEGFADSHGNAVLVCQTPQMLGFDRAGDLRWHLCNPHPGVHGAHMAGLPEPGKLQGVLFNLGCVPYSETADVFAAVNDHGRVFFITSDGLYLDELFNDCRVSARNDAALLGGEPFGGSFSWDRRGRRAILQAGGYRRYAIRGLDRVTESRLAFEVTPRQVEVARRHPPMKENGGKAVPPVLTAPGAAKWQAGATTVDFSVSATDKALVLKWSINDPSPWQNNGQDPYLMFKTGDCVDFQYLDKNGLPNRLMVSPKAGDPKQNQVIWYRHQAAKGEQALSPRAFSSPWRTHTVADVRFPTDIPCSVQTAQRRVVVDMRVPKAYFGAGDSLVCDFGVILGDAEGKINLTRSYWANKATGLVNDVPGELLPEPKRWGTLRFPAATVTSEKKTPMRARLEPVGVLVNPGGLKATPLPWQQTPGGAGPVYDAKRGFLYASAGARRVAAMRIDGTAVATYELPGAAPFMRFDTMALAPSGDVYVMAGGRPNARGGSVYRICAGAPDGMPAGRIVTDVVAMGPHVYDGRLLLVRPGGPNDAARLSFYDLKTGTEKPWTDFPVERAAYYTCQYDRDPKGTFTAVIRHRDGYRFAADGTYTGPHRIFGDRDLPMNRGLYCDGWLWALCGGTLKRLEPQTFAAKPGVVLGGASGWFIGRVDTYDELDMQGLSPVGKDLYAVHTPHNAAVWLLAWEEEKSAMRPVRRLGPIVDPQNLAIDDEGFVLCDNLVWPFNADPLSPPILSLPRMPERATAVLPNGRTVRVFDTHQLTPAVLNGCLREEMRQVKRGNNLPKDPSDGATRNPDGSQRRAEKPYLTRVVPAPDEPNLFELQAVHTNGLVRAYRVSAEGDFCGKVRYRTFAEAPPDTNRFEARDGDLMAVTDRANGTLRLVAVDREGREKTLDTVKNLAAPTYVAFRKGRIVVYESAAQRVLRYRVHLMDSGPTGTSALCLRKR